MIVLLPLRGWAGDQMGVQMGVQMGARMATQLATQMAAGDVPTQFAGVMPADCPMASMHADAANPDADAASNTAADSECCTSCDLCLPMSVLSVPQFALMACTGQVAPLVAGVGFLSAAPMHPFKPPIS